MIQWVVIALYFLSLPRHWIGIVLWMGIEGAILVFSFLQLRRLFQGAQQEAAQVSSKKAIYFSRMSHEIRTPLNSIIGFADILRETDLESDQAEYVQTIHRCSESLLHLINDILDVSRIENGLLRIDRHKFDIRELHEDIHKMFAAKCKEKCLNFHIQVDSHCPRYLEGDSHRLRQVLINLVGNAVKFTEQGEVRVQMQYSPEKQVYVWSVTDTGRGIQAENIPKLFRNFYQEDASISRRFGGSGLGLVISKNLVELMGGAIQVQSQQGKGTTFQFSLPLHQVYSEASDGSSSSS